MDFFGVVLYSNDSTWSTGVKHPVSSAITVTRYSSVTVWRRIRTLSKTVKVGVRKTTGTVLPCMVSTRLVISRNTGTTVQ